MVLGYVEKLSYREDVGTVGMSEIFDPPNVLQQKIEELAMMIQKSKHLVAFTGAGISTSCGIPDFRGPKGVWTLQLPETLGKRGGKRLRLEISTRKHTRNGYLRDFEVETIGMKETSLHCSDLKCRAKLKDTVLDWEGALPPKEMVPAVKHCKMADAVLCLGTRETLKTILFKIVLKLNFGDACGCLCTKIEWPIDF